MPWSSIEITWYCRLCLFRWPNWKPGWYLQSPRNCVMRKAHRFRRKEEKKKEEAQSHDMGQVWRTIDGWNPAPVITLYYLYKGFYIPGGAGCLPSTVLWPILLFPLVLFFKLPGWKVFPATCLLALSLHLVDRRKTSWKENPTLQCLWFLKRKKIQRRLGG